MKKETWLIAVTALLLMVVGGTVVLGNSSNSEVKPADAGAAFGVERGEGIRQRIARLQKGLEQDPKNPDNHAQWVQLGNDYFDSDQPALAVTAYENALELRPNDPEVLTDQGISCRKIGWYEKGADCFEKALKIDPNYEQGLVNQGMLYALDLKQPEKALQAWSRFLELNPNCQAAVQIRRWVEELQADPVAFAARK